MGEIPRARFGFMGKKDPLSICLGFFFSSFHCLFGFNDLKNLKQYYQIASQTLTLL